MLYFQSYEASSKVQNIERDSRVSLTVTPFFKDFGEMQGLTMAARAERVTDKTEIGDLYHLFLKRIPHMKQFSEYEEDTAYKEKHKIIDVPLFFPYFSYAYDTFAKEAPESVKATNTFNIGPLSVDAPTVSVKSKRYANLSKILDGSATILFLAEVPSNIPVLTIYGGFTMGFVNSDGEEVIFSTGSTLEFPEAILKTPGSDQTISKNVIKLHQKAAWILIPF